MTRVEAQVHRVPASLGWVVREAMEQALARVERIQKELDAPEWVKDMDKRGDTVVTIVDVQPRG